MGSDWGGSGVEVGKQALHALLCGMVGRTEGGKGALGFPTQDVGQLGWGEVGAPLGFLSFLNKDS